MFRTKITGRYPETIWEFIQDYLKDDREFYIRFGVVMLLSYFADDAHFQKGIQSLDSIRHEAYYVKMAVAWAISIYFVKMPDKTMEYLKNNSLDDFTHNKALQKITESRCVDSETKKVIKSLKKV